MREDANPRGGHSAPLHYGDTFGVLVVPTGDGGIVVELIGELDVVSMERFERAVAEVLADRPSELIFDLTSSPFVSAQGYSVMGRCVAVAKVTVRSRCSLAGRVLALYGYDDVVVLTGSEALHSAPR
jgi:anti-anti-sigma regulatory factor